MTRVQLNAACTCLDFLEGAKNLRTEGVVVVVDNVFYLSCPVYNNTLQVLYEILHVEVKKNQVLV